MYSEGDIVLIRYPNTDGSRGKRRPALLLKCVGNNFGDWFVLSCLRRNDLIG